MGGNARGDALGDAPGDVVGDDAPSFCLFKMAVLIALNMPVFFRLSMSSGSGSVVSMGISFTTTACDLMPSLLGPSFQMSRTYPLVSRVRRYTSQMESAHISATTIQNTYRECAVAMVMRFIPRAARVESSRFRSCESA